MNKKMVKCKYIKSCTPFIDGIADCFSCIEFYKQNKLNPTKKLLTEWVEMGVSKYSINKLKAK